MTAEVAARQDARRVDLKLRKATDLAAQLTNGEWIASMPGTRAAEEDAAQLRGLPYARAHRAFDA